MSEPRAVGRKCGACRLCCKVLPTWEVGTLPDGTRYDFQKPQGKWCEHASGAGCGIYYSEAKPFGCRLFACLWLRGYGREDDRPDLSHVVVGIEMIREDAFLMAYAARPGASFRPGAAALLDHVMNAPEYARLSGVAHVEPDLNEPRFIQNRAGGRGLMYRDPRYERFDLPLKPGDGDHDRARVAAVLSEEDARQPSIDLDKLTAAIIASGEPYRREDTP